MLRPWRPLALAAVLTASVGAGVATAQTVVVTNAPPGSTVEVVLNATAIGTATVKPAGDATIAVNLTQQTGKPETAAHVSVDVCENVRRVLIVEQGQSPPPLGPACTRREFTELFALRQVTTLVVDATENKMAVWVRQGPAPKAWLQAQTEGAETERVRPPSPTGLIVSGGGSFMRFRDTVSVACGNVTECSGKNARPAFTASAAYWFTEFAAAEVIYMRPAKVTAAGSGFSHRFSSELDPHVITAGGKGGVPLGRLRFYGQGGLTYTRATFTTEQTIDDYTITIDGVDQIIKGGTQRWGLRLAGWGWHFGGGGEIWVTARLAAYGEVGYARLKGTSLDATDGALDERATYVFAGARFHFRR